MGYVPDYGPSVVPGTVYPCLGPCHGCGSEIEKSCAVQYCPECRQIMADRSKAKSNARRRLAKQKARQQFLPR